MAHTGRRPDILDQQVDVTERVRKLEIMNHSRVLITKRWKPSNPTLDIAYAHQLRAVGMDPNTPAFGPLPQRIPPEADYIFNSGGWPDLQDLFHFWLQTGYGPMFWSADLVHASYAPYAFTTNAGTVFARHWQVGGPDAGDFYGAQTNPPGAGGNVYMDTYAGLPMIDGDPAPSFGRKMPDGGYFMGYKVVGDSRLYATGGMPAPKPCQDPPRIDNAVIPGTPHAYTIPVQNVGCPDNPLDPSGSSGYLDARYYTEDHKLIQLTAPPIAVDLLTAGQRSALEGNAMGVSDPVSSSTLRDRLALCLAAYPGIAAWYDGLIAVAQAELQARERAGWQTLPLYPPWWGRIECRYDARFVSFRGRVRNNDPNAHPRTIIAAYPNHLPIGSRTGNILPAHLDSGAPLQVFLSHSFRSERSDDYRRGEGSYLGLSTPQNWAGLSKTGDPLGFEIVMDGCQFPIFSGPYDGSNPPYPDLRV